MYLIQIDHLTIGNTARVDTCRGGLSMQLYSVQKQNRAFLREIEYGIMRVEFRK